MAATDTSDLRAAGHGPADSRIQANRLLVLSADPAARSAARAIAARLEYAVCSVAPHGAVREAFDDLSPTVVLLDVVGSVLHALEALRLMRRMRYRGEVAFLGDRARSTWRAVADFAACNGITVAATAALPVVEAELAEALRRLRRAVPRYAASDLCRAIRKGAVTAAFRPYLRRCAADIWRVAGATILPRWNLGSGTALSVGEFLPLTADPQVDAALLNRMLWLTHRAQTEWFSQGAALPITLTLPARFVTECRATRLCESWLAARAARFGVTLKLTAGDLDGWQPAWRAQLLQLRAHGYRVALDVAAADLWHGRQLTLGPVDEIVLNGKLTHSLTHSVEHRHLVRVLATAARDARVALRATGIENRTTLEAVLDLGVQLVQGELIAAAMPASLVAAWSESCPGREPAPVAMMPLDGRVMVRQ
jgi:EAL domain-containing protein (putative c-di-GMP-specific phosphodiesterase class I)